MNHPSDSNKGTHSSPWFTVFFRRGHLLVLTILMLLVAGLSSLTNLPRLEDPRIDTRNVLVITPYPGASAERVEALISDVIEDELSQLSEVKEINSTSRAGISVISVELQAWVDNRTNEQIFSKLRDALGDAEQQFPAGAGEPELDDKRGATSFTMLLAMSSPEGKTSPLSIRSRLSEELADRLRRMPGTELVRVYGGLDEEITVSIDANQLAVTGLSIAQASNLIAAADPKLPAGVMRTELQNVRLQVAEGLDSVQRVRNIPLTSNKQGNMLRIGDIAVVSRDWREPQTEIGLVNGEQVIFIGARMETTVRVDRWTEQASKIVQQFEQEYANSVHPVIVFEQNSYTEARLGDLTQNLLLGCIVVMLVVMTFMGLRAAWIVGLSLPLCAAFALFSLNFYEQQIHQISIFGIIIAIGLLIDNAIVITDEIRANLLLPEMSRQQALIKSVRHLFVPLSASTLTTILGFMPIFLLSGNIGDFIGSIAISVVMALIGSLFISLTLIAALAARFLPRSHQHQQPWYLSGLQMPELSGWFKQFLTGAIAKPLPALLFAIGLPILGFVLSGQLGNIFFPSADRDQFEFYLWMSDGSSIEQTHQLVTDINDHISEQAGVEQVMWLVGGSFPSVYYNQLMNRDNTPHFASGVVTADSVDRAAQLIYLLQDSIDERFPSAKVVVRAFGQGPPISAPLGVKIFGPDLVLLNQLGEQVRLIMSQIPGVTQSIASITKGEPELVFRTDRDISRFTDLNLSDIALQLQIALEGRLGGSILEDTEEIPIRIRLSEELRSNLVQIDTLPLTRPGDSSDLPLSALGKFELVPRLAGITRINGERVNKVEAFLLPSMPAVDASNMLQKLMAQNQFDLPQGYRIQLAGDADEQQEALGLLAVYAPVLLVMMIATLILSFSSVRLTGVIISVAMLSVGLGMLSLWISGLPIGFNPLLGSAGLIGVAINGSIVVIAAINGNPLARMGDIDQIVIETMGCSRHILSTTFTTVGGFIPLLLFSEGTFWPPLAVVLAGGVGFSVILSLVFTPVVIRQLVKRKQQQSVQQQIA